MGKVLKIGISKNKGDKIVNVNDVEAIKGKGLVGENILKKITKRDAKLLLLK